jgi:hypothetical protein
MNAGKGEEERAKRPGGGFRALASFRMALSVRLSP